MAGTVLALYALAAVASHLTSAPTAEPQPHLRYVITNLAGARGSEVSGAAADAERTFGRIGVRLRREDTNVVNLAGNGPGPCEPVLLVFLVGEETVRRAVADRDVVGFTAATAPGDPPVAMIAYDRVVAIADRTRIPRARMLASALAHELGHLMVPHGAHGRRGVMKGVWNAADVRQFGRVPPAFTAEDGEAIRTWLEARRSSPQQCLDSQEGNSRVE